MKGIQNTKEVLCLAFDGFDLGKGVLANGKVDAADISVVFAKLPQILSDIGPALADIGEIPGELTDLTAEESAELVAYGIARFGGTSEQVTTVINLTLAAVFANVKAVQAIITLTKA